jgi:hypothetical protein
MKFLVALIVSLSTPLGALEIAFYGTENFDLPVAPAISLRAETESWVMLPMKAWADRTLGQQALDAEALDQNGRVLQRSRDILSAAPFAPARGAIAIFSLPAGTRALQLRVRGKGPAVGSWNPGYAQVWPLQVQDERFGLGSTQIELEGNAEHLALVHTGQAMGSLTLPSNWSLAGRLARFEAFAPNHNVSTQWLLKGPKQSYGILRVSSEKDTNGIASDTLKLGITLQGPMSQPWVLSFVAPAAGHWMLPFNQGLHVPQVKAAKLGSGHDLDLRAGHFLSMAAWGWSRNGRGLRFHSFGSAEQALRLNLRQRSAGWVLRPTLGVWSQEQELLISGHNGSARAWSQGLAKSMVEGPGLKESLRPDQQARLAGAVNIHYWKKVAWWNNEPRPEVLAAEMHAAGLDRVLWSQKAAPEAVTPMAQLGWLLGSYENFQDLYPAETPFNWVNKDGWPEQAVHDRWGRWVKGWPHKEGGKTYYAGVRSSRAAVDYVRREIAARKRHGQHAVFFDTTTASGPVEDWNPLHPMTRSEDLGYKRAQLAYGVEQGLIVGSESGHDGALGAAHYFEGMQSPWVGRFEDSGYDLGTIKPATEAMLKWNLNPRYRAPLFDLAYHDRYVGYEYWGDAANRLPEHWRRKDLFSVLYGQPQLWVMDEERWKSQKAQAIKSYRTWSPVVRHLFGQRMTDWKVLDKVGDVQETHWEDGSIVRVDFAKDSIVLEGPLRQAVGPR